MTCWARYSVDFASVSRLFHVKQRASLLGAIMLPFFLVAPSAQAVERVIIPAAGVDLSGFFYAPPSSAAKQRAPAIVMLHGCSGLLDKQGAPIKSYAFWAEHFQRLGYAAVLTDSFSSRDVKEICTQASRTILPERERSRDAHATLAWLRKRADIDPDRIHLLGWSNGAMAVLHAVKVGAEGSAPGASFRSAVAFYPGCAAVAKERGYRLMTPLLIQSGAADDWTPAKPCEALVTHLREAGAEVAIDVYTEAHHSFDRLDLKVRHRPDVRNPNSPTGRGATIGSNPAAREKAIARTTSFVQAQNQPQAKP